MFLPEITSPLATLVLVATGAYLLGSIPFGMVIAKLMGLGNLRDIGSGNIGATNVLRTGNKLAAALTLIFDAGKGAVAVLLANACLGADAAQIAGLFAFLGHIYPIWLKFKGGKGVATFLGIALALNFWAGLAACMIWLTVALVVRISSLSALIATALSPILMSVFNSQTSSALALLLALLVWWRHRSNLSRLFAGTEPKIGKKGNS